MLSLCVNTPQNMDYQSLIGECLQNIGLGRCVASSALLEVNNLPIMDIDALAVSFPLRSEAQAAEIKAKCEPGKSTNRGKAFYAHALSMN